jgi:hypothetical protein
VYAKQSQIGKADLIFVAFNERVKKRYGNRDREDASDNNQSIIGPVVL